MAILGTSVKILKYPNPENCVPENNGPFYNTS